MVKAIPARIHKDPKITFPSIASPKKTAPQKIPVMGTRKIIEDAWTGEDLCSNAT